jgi:mannose-6-phosphate isomerase
MLDLDRTAALGRTQRIWAQAEYLRALTLRPDSEPAVLRQLQALQQHSCTRVAGTSAVTSRVR